MEWIIISSGRKNGMWLKLRPNFSKQKALRGACVSLNHRAESPSERACPICSRGLETTKVPVLQERLPQRKGKTLSQCFYCGGYLVQDGASLRVMTYSEFSILEEGDRAVLTRNRDAVLRYWRKQPLAAHPKPHC